MKTIIALTDYSGIEVSCRVEAGSVAQNLPALMAEENADLAVAGLRGANSA